VDSSGKETVLYAFSGGANGYGPTGVTAGAQGSFYGTTQYGGDMSLCEGEGCGTVFAVNAAGTETVLHEFKSKEAVPSVLPPSGLIKGRDGNFYGGFPSGFLDGCNPNCGNVYRLTP
jgi:uncharacterized repeat protein (TIGR03803 family)